jgi:drug/metabolite transporter (DMT)-like permease
LKDSGTTVSLLPLLLLLVLGSLWGVATSIGRGVAMLGVPPLGYAFWQTLGAGLLLLPVCALLRKPIQLSRKHLTYYLTCGVLGSAIPVSNMFFVLNHIPAGIMAMVLATTPLLTYLLAILLRQEPFVWQRAIGVLLGFLGAVLIVVPRGGFASTDVSTYVAMAFLTPVMYSVTNMYASYARPAYSNPFALAAGMTLAAGLAILPFALYFGQFHPLWARLDPANLLILAHIGIAGLAFVIFFTVLRIAGPVYISQVAYIVALAGIVTGMLVFGERHASTVWGAVGLIFAGVALVNSSQVSIRGRTARR